LLSEPHRLVRASRNDPFCSQRREGELGDLTRGRDPPDFETGNRAACRDPPNPRIARKPQGAVRAGRNAALFRHKVAVLRVGAHRPAEKEPDREQREQQRTRLMRLTGMRLGPNRAQAAPIPNYYDEGFVKVRHRTTQKWRESKPKAKR
jgi:hypothetical protein